MVRTADLEGKSFSRVDISLMFRGNPQHYLPIYQGKVTCGCFRRDLNPAAPYEILVGNAPMVVDEAEMLIKQTEAIPVFIKEIGAEKWAYQGMFTLRKYSNDIKDIASRAAGATPPRELMTDVVMVLFLDRER